jgi:ribose 5-phosphate isomerase B
MSISIAIGSDHAGFELKQTIINYLKSNYLIVTDEGCFSIERADYADYAHLVASKIINKDVNFGVLICGSGNGIAMSANKHKGIRAALCWNNEIARLSRQHNNANILVLPARFISNDEALKCINVFLSEKFEGGRHQNRVDKIDGE